MSVPALRRLLLACVAAGAIGCVAAPHVTTLVLLDGSCSRVNLDAYRDGWRAVVASAAPGDRLVLGRITTGVLQFRPDLDERRQTVSGWLENHFAAKVRDKKFLDAADGALDAALAAPCSDLTPILDTIDLAPSVLHSDSHAVERLVIFSDMLEDSDFARFDRLSPQGAEWTTLLDRRRRDGGLPDLSGVKVYVAGASAPTADLMRAVRGFWLAFFKASGAVLQTEHYGPILVGVDPEDR